LDKKHFHDLTDLVVGCLVASSDNRDLLYLLVVSQRMLLRIPESHHTGFPRLYQERGHCHVFQSLAPEAIISCERATQLNPALTASWKTLKTAFGSNFVPGSRVKVSC
jgi:hypothetical protein